MELRDIQELQKKLIEQLKWERFNATQVFTHLIEELSEIGKYFLYEERYKVKGAGHEGVDDELRQEFAQAFNLFLQLAIHSNVDLESAWLEEHEKNKERFDIEQWEQLAQEDAGYNA